LRGWGEEGGGGVGRGWGQGGEMTQALYAHMNNKINKINKLHSLSHSIAARRETKVPGNPTHSIHPVNVNFKFAACQTDLFRVNKSNLILHMNSAALPFTNMVYVESCLYSQLPLSSFLSCFI
jgi:hypothetical protein